MVAKKLKTLINPTGSGDIKPRDVWGGGEFLARVVGDEKHNKGVHLICVPGQPIIAPMEGRVTGHKLLKGGEVDYSYVEIVNGLFKVVLRYVVLNNGLENTNVSEGYTVGTAQDMGGKYMYTVIPHVVLEFWIANDPTDLLTNKEIEYEICDNDV